VPAAAVRRVEQALFGMIERKTSVGGFCVLAIKSHFQKMRYLRRMKKLEFKK